MDLFEQPTVSYTSLRQETAIQHGLGQKAAFYAVSAMACQYLYAMNGFDGMVRSANSVDETIAADCGDTRTMRGWRKAGRDWAIKLRKGFGKGRNDDTCRVKAIRDAGDAKAAFYMLATSLDACDQSVSGLLRYLGRDEFEAAKDTVAPSASDTEAKAIASDASESSEETDARAIVADNSKAVAVSAILAGIGARGETLGFGSADYAAIVAALLPHIHGQHLADTIAAAQGFAMSDDRLAAAA